MELKDLLLFIKRVEEAHFRTRYDSGAHPNAMLIWNQVREFANLPRINLKDLPAHCSVHNRYHVIREDYGCAPVEEDHQ